VQTHGIRELARRFLISATAAIRFGTISDAKPMKMIRTAAPFAGESARDAAKIANPLHPVIQIRSVATLATKSPVGQSLAGLGFLIGGIAVLTGGGVGLTLHYSASAREISRLLSTKAQVFASAAIAGLLSCTS
jgi:hypothetical protein